MDIFKSIIESNESIKNEVLCFSCDKDYCCKNRVDIDVLNSEFEFISKNLINKDLKKKIKKARKQKSKRGTFTCPFLADGKCSIYEFRPLSCRTFFALKDNEDSTPEQCLDHDNYHNLLTTSSFVNYLASSDYRNELLNGYKSILDL